MLLGPPSEWSPWCEMQSLLGMHSGTATRGDTTALCDTPTGLTARIYSGVVARGGRRLRRWRLGLLSGDGMVTGLIHVPEGRNAGITHRLFGRIRRELVALRLIVLVGGVCSWFVAMILLGTISEKSLIECCSEKLHARYVYVYAFYLKFVEFVPIIWWAVDRIFANL